MLLPKFSQTSAISLALALASPTLACVQFSCNLNSNNGLFNAALTDNGGQKCSTVNLDVGYHGGASNYVISLNCDSGYSATFHSLSGLVEYSYSGFSGSFGTSVSSVNGATYYTANVWNC